MKIRIIEIIAKKDLKESIFTKNFLIFQIFNIILCFGLIFLIPNKMNNEYLLIIFMLFFPSIFSLLFSLEIIHEKFYEEKLKKQFDFLLISPISVKELFLGKIANLIILNSISIIISLISLSLTLRLINKLLILDFSIWIFILVIPIFSLLILSLLAWISFRYENNNILEVLNCFILIFALGFLVFNKKIIELLVKTQNMTLNLIILIIIGIICLILCLIYLINILDKEKIVG